jgi:hypothetical protein
MHATQETAGDFSGHAFVVLHVYTCQARVRVCFSSCAVRLIAIILSLLGPIHGTSHVALSNPESDSQNC